MAAGFRDSFYASFFGVLVALFGFLPLHALATVILQASAFEMPLSVVIGEPYTGRFACMNFGTENITNVGCSISGLPGWATVAPCSPTTPVATLPPAPPGLNGIVNYIFCRVSGVPTTVGTFPVTVTAVGDGVSNSYSNSINVFASATELSVSLTLPVGIVGQAYSTGYICNSAGPIAPINRTCSIVGLPGWAVRTCFPPGSSYVLCTISGMPTAAGASSVTVTTAAENAVSATSAGVLTVTQLACNINFSGVGTIDPNVDGVMLSRRLIGIKGQALINGLGSGLSFSVREYDGFVTERQYKALESSPSAAVSGLVVLRLMQGVADANLLTSITLPAASPLQSAAAIRADVNTKCGTSF